jgi:hypothetical protein
MFLRARVWLILIPLICILLAFLALAFYTMPAFQAPRIVRIEPAEEARDILPASPITITFSAPMNSAETENNIRLQPRVDGAFVWHDAQTVTFVPRTQLPISTTLMVRVDTDARSWLQRPLQENFAARFTTLTRPYVTKSVPARDAQFVYVPDRVRIEFNRALSEEQLASALTISPTVQNFSAEWNRNILTLAGFFEPRTRYEILIPANVTDSEYQIALGRAATWSFTTTEQYPNFSILNRGRVLKFSANETAQVPVQLTNVSRLDAALYVISPQEFENNVNAPFETWYAFAPERAPLKAWHVMTNAAADQYTKQSLEFAPLPRGFYFLQINSPEGVSDRQLIQID